ncbi:phytoene desaturase family protein [Spirochaetota bacterium]
MKTKECDAIIIGAGPNGLICGGYLAKAGLKVVICEARHETGGGLDSLEYGGFRHNPHATYHMMGDIMPAYKDFDLGRKGVKYIYPDVQAAYLSKNNKPLIMYRDPEKTVQYIAATFNQDDAEKYRRMYTEFTDFTDKILIPLTYAPAVPAVEQVQTLSSAKDDVGKRFEEFGGEHTPLQILDRYEFSDPINAALLNFFCMWGNSPFEALGYLFPLYVNRMTNCALCAGGSHRVNGGLHRAVVENGGEILDKADVVKVIMEGGKVAGVVTSEGREIKAKTVVSTVDPKQTFLDFFDEGEIPDDLVSSAERWEWEKSTYFGMHLGMKEAPQYIGTEDCPDANKAMLTFLGIGDTDELLDHVEDVEDGKLPGHLYGHCTVSSLFDPIMAPPGMHSGRWESNVPYDADWDNIAEDYADQCIAEWKKYAPNLDYMQRMVYPPTYIAKKFKNMPKGSIKQGSYIPLQMGYFRPNDSCSQNYTPIEGYYVGGASCYPGGMVLGGGGYNAANIICDDLGVKRAWDEPEIVKEARERGLIAED